MKNVSKETTILPFLAVLLGILFFCFGSYFYTTAFKFIFDKGIPQKFVLILFSVLLVILLGFIISAIGVFYRKRWALRLLLGLTIFAYLSIMKPLFLISYYSIVGLNAISLFVLSIITFWLCCKKATREQFGLIPIAARSRKLRTFNRIFGIFGYSFLILIIAIVLYYIVAYFIIYPQQRIIYMAKDDTDLSQRYRRREIFNSSLLLPKNLQVQSLIKISLLWNKNCIVTMSNPQGDVKVGIGLDLMGDLYKYFGYRSSYEFQRRLNRFCHFITQHLPKSVTEEFQFSDIVVGEQLEGFLAHFPRKKQLAYVYQLYNKDDKEISANIYLLSEKDALNDKQREDIIGSLKLFLNASKSAEQFFQEGLSFINEKQYENAKVSFVNALYQNWQNPKYHYYLGLSFFETDNFDQAKFYVEKAIALKPSYSNAITLLQKINDKLKSK